jgi:hypothetical protein
MKIDRITPDDGRVLLQAEGTLVTLAGDIDQASPKTFLAPFFDAIHAAAEDEGLREVKVDILGLHFLNSSAVKEIIGWLLRRNHLPAGKKYVVEFIYDSSILWQRVTMPTLSQLDPDFVVLSDRAKASRIR